MIIVSWFIELKIGQCTNVNVKREKFRLFIEKFILNIIFYKFIEKSRFFFGNIVLGGPKHPSGF